LRFIVVYRCTLFWKRDTSHARGTVPLIGIGEGLNIAKEQTKAAANNE
jgi:hypothetical protein